MKQLVCIISIPLTAISLHADEELAETVITANRGVSELMSTPFSVDYLSDADLRHNMHFTLSQSLAELPGVMNQKTNAGSGSPYIRGFTGFRNLMLVDGIRFNNSVFRDGPNQYWGMIDQYSLSGVELVRGSGSVLYGSDSVGGTVNALTSSTGVDQAIEGQQYWHGNVHYNYDSASRSNTGRLETMFGVGNEWGLRLGFTARDVGDLRAADVGRMPYTGYGVQAFDAKFDYVISNHTRLTLAHQQLEQDGVWRTHKTIYGIDWEGTDHGDELRRVNDQDRSLSYFRLEGTDVNQVFDHWQFTLSYQTLTEERDRVRSDGRRDLQGFGVDTYGANLLFRSNWVGGTLSYGLDYYQDRVDSYRRDYNADGSFKGDADQGPVGDDGKYETYGAYANNVWDINDQWKLTLGGRYSYIVADIGTVSTSDGIISINESYDALVFNARLLYQQDDNWSHWAGIAQSFRAPNLSDLSRLDSARSDEIETPSPGLKPEDYISYELGTRYASECASAQFSVFYTDISNMIVRTPTGNVIDGDYEVTKRNGGDGYVWGFELSGDWQFYPQWTAFGQLAWIDGEVETYPSSDNQLVSEPMDRLMPATARLGVRWTELDGRYWVEGFVDAAAKADKLSSRDESDTNRIPPGGTPGYVVPTIRGGWQATDSVLLTATLENLSDVDYRIHGSGLNEAGFNAKLGITYAW